MGLVSVPGGFPGQSGNRSFDGNERASGAPAEGVGWAALGEAASSATLPRKVLRSADKLPALHHHADMPDGADVARRVAVDGDEIGEEAGSDGAAIAEMQDARVSGRRRD